MRAHSTKLVAMTNHELADLLDEAADRLHAQAANPFRVAAYRNGAATVRAWQQSLADVFTRQGLTGLEAIPHIGKSLAKKIAEMLRKGRFASLEKLRQKQAAGDVLTSLPTVGPRTADRIRSSLGANTLEEVYAAAYDGRLRRVEGMGRKRVQAIRESLSLRLNHPAPPQPQTKSPLDPSVEELLELDRIYRERAAKGRLLTVAPRRFNPTGEAWLPVLRIKRRDRRYCIYYANTARSHQLDHLHDWVVIYCLDKEAFGRWTVITSTYGTLRGRRIVRGREAECKKHYGEAAPVQLSLLPLSQAIV